MGCLWAWDRLETTPLAEGDESGCARYCYRAGSDKYHKAADERCRLFEKNITDASIKGFGRFEDDSFSREAEG